MSRMRGPFFALLLISSRLLAQETTGTLQGTVTDPSGAVSPGVSIVATNLATNVSREAKSDASGLYSIRFLPAGEYSVTATLQGFKVQKVERMVLQVQQVARVDFQMAVGSVNESIEVSLALPLCRPRTRQSGPSSMQPKSSNFRSTDVTSYSWHSSSLAFSREPRGRSQYDVDGARLASPILPSEPLPLPLTGNVILPIVSLSTGSK
jgi:hypothetical protein